VLVAFVLCGWTPTSKGTERPDPEEWIFAVVMRPYIITDGIIAFSLDNRYYFPIVELSEAFEFYSDFEPDRGYVSGWASREENSYSIDVQKEELIIKGIKYELEDEAVLTSADSDYILDDYDIYVQKEVLEKIWPIKFLMNLSELTVAIDATEELSFERRLARLERRKKLEAIRQYEKRLKSFRYVPNKYQLLGKPSFDFATSYSYDAKHRSLSGGNGISGSQQLGGFVANYGTVITYDPEHRLRRPDSINFNMSRQAYEGESLLGLGFDRVDAGDIGISNRSLIGNTGGGRGVALYSSAGNKETEFDRITVEGRGPIGWETELYNNNNLIEFGEVDRNGEYRFEDVVLNFGFNRIRVVLYGPQGQVREHIENYSFSSSMLSPGDTRYSMGFVDLGRKLITLTNEPRDTLRGVAMAGQAAYGLSRDVTTFGSVAKMMTREGVKRYLTGGFAADGLGFQGTLEAYKEINGGSALDVHLLTKLMGLNLNLRGAVFNNFESNDAGFGDNTKRVELDIGASTNIPTPFGGMSLNLDVAHNESKFGVANTNVTLSESINLGGLGVSNKTTSRFNNEMHTSSSGTSNLDWRSRDWEFKGTMNYLLHPTSHLTSASGQARYKTSGELQASITAQHSFADSTSNAGMQLGYEFDKFISSIGATYARHQGWTFSVRTSSSLGPYKGKGSYDFTGRSKRRSGTVLTQVFLDYDNDGVFSDGDEPLEGVGLLFNGNRSTSNIYTDSEGYLIDYTPTGSGTISIEVDPQTLMDPYYRPVVEGYKTHPLSGSTPVVNFAIIETGAIDGEVYRTSNDTPVAGLKLELVNIEGQIVMSTETAFDGYYSFEFTPPGEYIVRAAASYGNIRVTPVQVSVTPDDLFIAAANLLLRDDEVDEDVSADEASIDDEEVVSELYEETPAYEEAVQPEYKNGFKGFYVTETGAIEGKLLGGQEAHKVGGIAIELVNSDGDVFMTANTAEDGTYSFKFIPLGTYVVRVDQSYKVNVSPVTVPVASEDLFITGVDLQILEQAEGALTADEAESGASGRVAQTRHSEETVQPAPLPIDSSIAVVKRVRIGDYPGKVRLVLDVSEPTEYQVSRSDDGKSVNIDLSDISWNALSYWHDTEGMSLLDSLEVIETSEGKVRVQLTVKSSVSVGANDITASPKEEQGYRLYIDLVGKTPG
jgi:hypothetical protein